MAHPKVVVWLGERLAASASKWLPAPSPIVSTAKEFAMVSDPSAITFVDATTLTSPILESASGPIIAVCDEPLRSAVGWLHAYPWLNHVISASTLASPRAKEHIKNVATTLGTRSPNLKSWLGPETRGRRVELAQASKRAARLERMEEFFVAYNVAPRGREFLRDAADEMLTNAFYDAPVAAGAVPDPIARTQDVVLPAEHAIEIAYGCSDTVAIVRVRDPFGSMSRRRLADVLVRCAGGNGQVEVDTSMGGAGLGLWRVFSKAAFVSISVSRGRHTEFLVGIPKQHQTRVQPHYAMHLFFHDSQRRKKWKWADAVVADEPRAVTITFT